MRRIALLTALLLVLASPWARAQEGESERGGGHQLPKSGVEELDKAREKACGCCQECEAATKAVKGKEEGTEVTSACRDCCDHCGREKQPEKMVPPEIVK